MNQYWIKCALIVSGLIIFLAVVAPSILQVILSFSRKDLKERNSDSRNLRSAVWAPIVFMGTFMVLLGICVFSFRYSDCPILLDFMSLASAIVSIILAVLTIVYSYYTSSANMKNLGKIEDSADTIIKTSEHICKISEQVDQLEGMIEDLKPYIGHEMQKLGDAFKKNEYDNSNSFANSQEDSKKRNSQTMDAPFDYNSFLETFSIIGILFLHVCVKCEYVKERISFREIAKIFETAAVQYLLGILVTLNSLFGENCVDVDYDQTCIIINSIDVDFKNAIEKRMQELMSTNKVVRSSIKRISIVLDVDMDIEKNNE